jgi:hypothetical protein
MRTIKTKAAFVASAFALVLLATGTTFAQGVHQLHVAQGEKQKVQGVVSIRTGDSFNVRDTSGGETTVLLTGSTDVTSHTRGLRGKKEYPVTYIMRGLRLQAQGRGDSSGNLVD